MLDPPFLSVFGPLFRLFNRQDRFIIDRRTRITTSHPRPPLSTSFQACRIYIYSQTVDHYRTGQGQDAKISIETTFEAFQSRQITG